MYFVMYNEQQELICEDIDFVLSQLVSGWKLYGYSDTEKLAVSLLYECKFE